MMMMVMAPSSRASNPNGVTVLLIICFLIFPSKSATSTSGVVGFKERVGSRPPRCVNKCLSCRPCTATLVASQHHRTGQRQNDDPYKAKSRDETYYLLSWKCKCGDKLFQP